MACCDVCAYSLSVSHLVVTQASRLAVRCRERPLMSLVTTCLPPHVVTSEKPVKFLALNRLMLLYHEPMTTCSLPSRLSFCTLPTPLLPRGVTVPLQPRRASKTRVQRVRFICCTSSHDHIQNGYSPIDAHDHRCLSIRMAVHS